MSAFHRVVFTPSGLEGKVASGTSVLEAARQLGADLDTVCGGRGICGRCQVTPSVGRFAKWGIDATPDALTAPAAIETDYHANRPLAPGNRLGCAARIVGDVVVDVPAESQVHRQVVRKDLDLAPVTVDPSFRLYYVEVPAARLGDGTRSAASALAAAVADQHGIEPPAVAATLLPTIHGALGEVTVAVHHDDGIVAFWPGYVDTAYGVAVDIGSTTVAGHLCDLASGDGARLGGADEPADPLRRGPHEPGVVRDDEPGR